MSYTLRGRLESRLAAAALTLALALALAAADRAWWPVELAALMTAVGLVLDADSTVQALTDDTRTLALAGVHAQWAFPAADTLAGAKYAARGFLHRVCRTR